MDMTYRKNLLEQLRLVVCRPAVRTVDSQLMTAAVTANQELVGLGYTLKPADIIRLAGSDDLNSFPETFRQLIPQITAAPFYPDFPDQVMAIDEAQFRFHQICHYMSTYGVEEAAWMLGIDHEVQKGWLPEVTATEKTDQDAALLSGKVVELISEADMYRRPLAVLFSRTERLKAQELEIIREALGHVNVTEIDFSIPFKANMLDVFMLLARLPDADLSHSCLRRLCQHTGDIIKCLDYYLTHNAFHLTTSQKKRIVRLIESYPEADWRANVILSERKGRRTILLLNYLSYNRFSRSEPHREVVRQLRNGELASWESQAREMLANHDPEALSFIAKRPGMLLRWVNWLLKLGYDPKEIESRLLDHAEELSLKTVVTAATLLGRDETKQAAFDVFLRVLNRKLQLLDTPFKGRRVFIDPGRLDLEHSMILAKNDEAGYVRNGLAYRTPDNVNAIRFFVYWNDEHRVDIDLHATAVNDQGFRFNVGWNEDFRGNGICHSGDLTESDSAEYIDVNIDSRMLEVQFNVNLYYGKPTFRDIDKCFIGLMGVERLDAKVPLYDPKNCFFCNDIRSAVRTLNYGYLNLKHHYLALDGLPANHQWMAGAYSITAHTPSRLNLRKYLEMLMEAQSAAIVTDKADAELTLVMEKPEQDDQISLIDNNFFF